MGRVGGLKVYLCLLLFGMRCANVPADCFLAYLTTAPNSLSFSECPAERSVPRRMQENRQHRDVVLYPRWVLRLHRSRYALALPTLARMPDIRLWYYKQYLTRSLLAVPSCVLPLRIYA